MENNKESRCNKTCTRCSENKDISSYRVQKGGKYGVGSVCKICMSEILKIKRANYTEEDRMNRALWQAEWRRKNPDRQKEIGKKSRDKNKEIINNNRRERYNTDENYRQKRRELDIKYKESGRRSVMNKLNPRHRERAKEWKIKNPEKERERQKKYYKNKWHEIESKRREDLHEQYVLGCIKKQTNYNLSTSDIPKELVELKRESIKLKRLLKQKEDGKKQTDL